MKPALTLLLVILGFSAFAQKRSGKKYPLILVSEVVSTHYDTFKIKAVVKDIYHCPPCPPGAMCKPCMGEHVTVQDLHEKSNASLVVFTKTPDQFVKDKIYFLTLQLGNKAVPDMGTSLIAFVPSKK